MVAQPLQFTVAFRKKMAELSQRQRQDWLAALATQARTRPTPPILDQLREVARGCRLPLPDAIEKQLGPFDPRHLRAILEVPRERFVRPDDLERSADDAPLPLDDEGLSTISAPHAYCLSFRLVELEPGDALVELGSGSGYGAALAAFIVGTAGHVVTFEIDDALFHRAELALHDQPNVTVRHADAVTSHPRWGDARKVIATFAVETLPSAWVDGLPDGGRLVAPVGVPEHQRLVLVRRDHGRVIRTDHGAVRYVVNRSGR